MADNEARSRVEFYLDAQGLHRWRRRDEDGDILAASCAGYDDEAQAQEAMLKACNGLGNTTIVSLGEEGQS